MKVSEEIKRKQDEVIKIKLGSGKVVDGVIKEQSEGIRTTIQTIANDL